MPRSRALDAATLLVALAVVAAGALLVPVDGVGAAGDDAAAEPISSQAALTVSNADVAAGDATSVDVVLSEAPEGLAGFAVTVELDSPGVATVADASYPDAYGHTTTPDVADDGSSVRLEAVDLHDEVTAGDADVPLATIELRGEEHGETGATVTDVQVDADGGAPVDPTLEPGTVRVTATSSGDAPGASSAASENGVAGSSADATSDDATADASEDATRIAPWKLGAVAVAALASLLAVVIGRYR